MDGTTEMLCDQTDELVISTSSTRATLDENGIPQYGPDQDVYTAFTDDGPLRLSYREHP